MDLGGSLILLAPLEGQNRGSPCVVGTVYLDPLGVKLMEGIGDRYVEGNWNGNEVWGDDPGGGRFPQGD